MTRDEILEIIRHTADANGGVALGENRLTRLGVSPSVWGKYWARLSAAQREAGLTPNRPNARLPEAEVLAKLAVFTRELGAFPTVRDRIMKRRECPDFPSDRVFKRLGPRTRLVARLVEYARGTPGLEDVATLCSPDVTSLEREAPQLGTPAFGSVYLLKGPSHRYKIGRTNAFGRRRRELTIQLPFDTRKVHVIETDDPQGVESYWHQRFAEKRINSEWFHLTAEDVAAFRRWKRLR